MLCDCELAGRPAPPHGLQIVWFNYLNLLLLLLLTLILQRSYHFVGHHSFTLDCFSPRIADSQTVNKT